MRKLFNQTSEGILKLHKPFLILILKCISTVPFIKELLSLFFGIQTPIVLHLSFFILNYLKPTNYAIYLFFSCTRRKTIFLSFHSLLLSSVTIQGRNSSNSDNCLIYMGNPCNFSFEP